MGTILALLIAAASDAIPLELHVGKSVAACKANATICVATCDEPDIVAIEDGGAQGVVFKGLKPGTAQCSGSGDGQRNSYRVTVKP